MQAITPTHIRKIILEQSKRAHVGHIGSALSIVEIISALYGEILHIPAPDDPQRERFILSKGHAALALYAALHLKGWIDQAQLDTFCGDNSLLGVHPEHDLIGVDFSTGSLGQGLSMGVGAALAAHIQGSERRTFVLISDAECNEGSVWEAAQFAAQHKLSKLIVILDANGQQAFGYTSDVLNQDNIIQRWQAFGWDVREVNGHDVAAIRDTIHGLDAPQPHLIVARTTFGKGVSYMESQIKWHYFPMDDAQYAQALAEVEQAN